MRRSSSMSYNSTERNIYNTNNNNTYNNYQNSSDQTRFATYRKQLNIITNSHLNINKYNTE